MGFLIKFESFDFRAALPTIGTEIENIRREAGGRLRVGLFQRENAIDQNSEDRFCSGEFLYSLNTGEKPFFRHSDAFCASMNRRVGGASITLEPL